MGGIPIKQYMPAESCMYLHSECKLYKANTSKSESIIFLLITFCFSTQGQTKKKNGQATFGFLG